MGSEAKWTPGPWRVRTNPKSGIAEGIDTAHDVQAYFKNGKPRGNPTPIGVVCGLVFMRWDDAHLIAAAPALYEGLRKTIAALADDGCDHHFHCECARCQAIDDGEAALALAEKGGE